MRELCGCGFGSCRVLCRVPVLFMQAGEIQIGIQIPPVMAYRIRIIDLYSFAGIHLLTLSLTYVTTSMLNAYSGKNLSLTCSLYLDGLGKSPIPQKIPAGLHSLSDLNLDI
jgi:hypothetical protein